MAIVDLSTDVALNPDHVISVTLSCHHTHVLIRTVDGNVHEIAQVYGKSIWETKQQILNLLTTTD